MKNGFCSDMLTGKDPIEEQLNIFACNLILFCKNKVIFLFQIWRNGRGKGKINSKKAMKRPVTLYLA